MYITPPPPNNHPSAQTPRLAALHRIVDPYCQGITEASKKPLIHTRRPPISNRSYTAFQPTAQVRRKRSPSPAHWLRYGAARARGEARASGLQAVRAHDWLALCVVCPRPHGRCRVRPRGRMHALWAGRGADATPKIKIVMRCMPAVPYVQLNSTHAPTHAHTPHTGLAWPHRQTRGSASQRASLRSALPVLLCPEPVGGGALFSIRTHTHTHGEGPAAAAIAGVH